ncbi:hypothetical protein M0208_08390 [Sphingomonas sp. SUN019]|uniref:hypothetical protein n=1 Tax=Sphingomonas sp. SUN019 TaxID=2937788 RepID=UPI00216458F3|nr:hypothetical protein [Sphingomonas sp. SUN019]UVO50535.1 hypothetical protein M0208_08390 [Sphingomonas sp. SUN019]
MKPIIALSALALLSAPLAACGGQGDDKLASRVEESAENRADQMEATADNLEDQAEQVRENGEDRAEAIDDSDVNADALTETQKADVVNNGATVVK